MIKKFGSLKNSSYLCTRKMQKQQLHIVAHSSIG